MITMIEVKNLSKNFGTFPALNEVSFKVERGSFTAFVGPNGAGKSTLFRVLLGLTEKDRGSIQIDGCQMKRSAWPLELKKKLGFSPESLYIHGHLTGREFLRFVAQIKGEIFPKVDQMLERFRLGPSADKKVSTYSKGMKQRLVLSQALLGEPKLLFLDEPTGGLDPRGTMDFYEFMTDLRKKGVTVIMNSHFLEEIETQMDQVGILIEGKLVAFASPSQLIEGSGLPDSIELKLKTNELEQIPEKFRNRAQPLQDHSFLISCSRNEKLDLMKDLFTRGTELQDLKFISPSLAKVYHTYLRGANL